MDSHFHSLSVPASLRCRLAYLHPLCRGSDPNHPFLCLDHFLFFIPTPPSSPPPPCYRHLNHIHFAYSCLFLPKLTMGSRLILLVLPSSLFCVIDLYFLQMTFPYRPFPRCRRFSNPCLVARPYETPSCVSLSSFSVSLLVCCRFDSFPFPKSTHRVLPDAVFLSLVALL